MVAPKKRVLIVTKNETKTPKANLKKISPYKKDNTYRYIKNAAIATTAAAATAVLTTGLYKLYQDRQKEKETALNTVNNALRLEDQAAVRAREEQEAAALQAQALLEAKEAEAKEAEAKEAERIANEKAAAEAKEAEMQKLADEKAAAETERLQKEKQIIQEAERFRLEGIAAVEKAKEEQRLADEKEKQRIADEQARAEIQKLADEKAEEIEKQRKLQADAAQRRIDIEQAAADKRLQEAKQRRIDIEQAAADKAADKIQTAKQREQYLEAEKLAKIKKVEDEKIKALAKQRELNNLYAEFAKMPGFRVSDEELANVYENFIKFSEHREKNCLVTSGKCPDCFAASKFQICLAKELKNNNVDFNKIINIMKEFHYNVSELGVGGGHGLQFRKDVSTGNLHLNYPVKENAKIR